MEEEKMTPEEQMATGSPETEPAPESPAPSTPPSQPEPAATSQEVEEGKTEVTAIDPVGQMNVSGNTNLKELAQKVRAELEKVLERL